MHLHLNLTDPAHTEILDRVKSLSLAFELEEVDGKVPILVEGGKRIIGSDEIAKHLDDLSGELHSWYYCNC